MLNKRIILRVCLLVVTGISCNFFSRVFTNTAPSQETQPELYSLNDAMTLAAQTLQAELQFATPTNSPAQDEVSDTSDLILCMHRVALGETLECIGRGYAVIPEVIAYVNEIDMASELEVGQELEIPAVHWTTVSNGPVCSPQCIPPDWELGSNEQDEIEVTGEQAGNPEGTGASPTEPPPTRDPDPEPPPTGDPPFFIIPELTEEPLPVWELNPDKPDLGCSPGICPDIQDPVFQVPGLDDQTLPNLP